MHFTCKRLKHPIYDYLLKCRSTLYVKSDCDVSKTVNHQQIILERGKSNGKIKRQDQNQEPPLHKPNFILQ